jgi:hypothetical protein
VVLAALGDDLFTVVGDPGRRYQFLRGEDGAVTGFDVIGLGGPAARVRRTP